MTRKPSIPKTASAALKEPKGRTAREMIDEGVADEPAAFTPPKGVAISDKPISLGALLSKKPIHQKFRMWIIGDTPLIVHSWSHKAKEAMLAKQVKATKAGRDERDPDQDFLDSLYEMVPAGKSNKPAYGFPVTGLKNAILSSAHKDKGIARVGVMQALFLDAEMVRARPAKAGAICDMPLVRIHGGDPEMREDMVKIGAGLNKTANLSYRGQFTVWGIHVTGRFDPAVVTQEALVFLVQQAGMASGLGEWRNERKGVFGSFHLGSPDEEAEWDAYVAGKGPLPIPPNYAMPQAAE